MTAPREDDPLSERRSPSFPTGRGSGTRLRASVRWLGPPVAVWAFALTAVTASAAAFGYAPFDSGTWSRWDSGLYLEIAERGYTFFPCQPPFDQGTWCGNAGWFPAFPWLVGGLHWLGLPLRGSAVALSWFCICATIVLLWTILGRRVSVATFGALLYAAFAPGQVYDYAIFPLSLLALSTTAHLWLLSRDRFVAAGLAGAVAALSYPVGALLVPVSAIWLLAGRTPPLLERLRRTAWASGLTLAGLAVLPVDHVLETGRWNAYILVQDHYHHTLQNPFVAAWNSFHLDVLQRSSPFTLANAPAIQSLIVLVVLVAVAGSAVVHRRSLDRLDTLVMLWAVATWLFPLTQANLSQQRSQAALLPLTLLARRLPPVLLVALVIAAAVIAVMMEKLFLQGVLV
jgi:hypothetical protein